MSHFLHVKDMLTRVMPQHAGVRIDSEAVKGKVLVIAPPEGVEVLVLQQGTKFVLLPAGYEVRNAEGVTMEASGLFAISAETADPYHALIDVDVDVWGGAPISSYR